MIKKLKWFIDDQLYYLDTFDGLNWEQTEEVDPRSVEDFLTYIEKSGMLPPERTYTQAFKNGSVAEFSSNSWEPEDEA